MVQIYCNRISFKKSEFSNMYVILTLLKRYMLKYDNTVYNNANFAYI